MVYHTHLVNKPQAAHLQRGSDTENLACNYLQVNGLQFVQKNYRIRTGEIDLIMRDGNVLIFVEVRYRKSQRYGGALHSIDPRKQARIIRTAQHYLQYRAPDAQVRFDVVAVEGDNGIQWIKNAFDLG